MAPWVVSVAKRRGIGLLSLFAACFLCGCAGRTETCRIENEGLPTTAIQVLVYNYLLGGAAHLGEDQFSHVLEKTRLTYLTANLQTIEFPAHQRAHVIDMGHEAMAADRTVEHVVDRSSHDLFIFHGAPAAPACVLVVSSRVAPRRTTVCVVGPNERVHLIYDSFFPRAGTGSLDGIGVIRLHPNGLEVEAPQRPAGDVRRNDDGRPPSIWISACSGAFRISSCEQNRPLPGGSQ